MAENIEKVVTENNYIPTPEDFKIVGPDTTQSEEIVRWQPSPSQGFMIVLITGLLLSLFNYFRFNKFELIYLFCLVF